MDNPKPSIYKKGDKHTISVVGAAGYTGMELVRLLQFCDHFELKHIIGDRTAGKYYSEVYPAFRGVVDMQIEGSSAIDMLDTDFVVLALPHGASSEVADRLISRGFRGGIVDMGSDLRLKSVQDYQSWYGVGHEHPNLLEKAVYGLMEFNRDAIRTARLVANPGCFASAIQLGVLPLIKAGVTGPFHITGLTGSTGSGVNPSAGTHFTTRDGNLKAYKVLEHQHLGEIQRQISDMGCGIPELNFVPVSAPFTRGIWITISVNLDDTVGGEIEGDGSVSTTSTQDKPATGRQLSGSVSSASSQDTAATGRQLDGSMDISAIYESTYHGFELVRLRSGLPELKSVVGTAYTDIGWVRRGNTLVVGVAIDNLGKGAAGQAIQNLNVMAGFEDSKGLRFAGQIL